MILAGRTDAFLCLVGRVLLRRLPLLAKASIACSRAEHPTETGPEEDFVNHDCNERYSAVKLYGQIEGSGLNVVISLGDCELLGQLILVVARVLKSQAID